MKTLRFPNFYANVASAGTPVPFLEADDDQRVITGPASILITARKDKTTANTGNVYFGGRNSQSEVLAPGDRLVLEVGCAERLDLSEIFLDAATTDDGVAVTVKH